jgi:hypothetical protein
MFTASRKRQVARTAPRILLSSNESIEKSAPREGQAECKHVLGEPAAAQR